MLNNGAKWYNFSPPRWSFIAPPLTSGTSRCRKCKLLLYFIALSEMGMCCRHTHFVVVLN